MIKRTLESYTSSIRAVPLKTYVSAGEAYVIKNVANSYGMTVSSYIRSRLLGTINDDEYFSGIERMAPKKATKRWE